MDPAKYEWKFPAQRMCTVADKDMVSIWILNIEY